MTGGTCKRTNCRENNREGIESCYHGILAFCSFTVTDQDRKKKLKKTFLFNGDFVRSMNLLIVGRGTTWTEIIWK